MSVKRKKHKSAPKYVMAIVVCEVGRLVLETNDDQLLIAAQILLRRLGFNLNVETISPCG